MFRPQIARTITRIQPLRTFKTGVAVLNTQKPPQHSQPTATPTPTPTQQQHQEQHQGHNQEPEQPTINPHAAFYKDFGMPLVKVLAVTFTTYYGLMYLWEYLESQEMKDEK